MYVCNVCMYVCIYVLCMYICYVCMYVCLYVCVCMYEQGGSNMTGTNCDLFPHKSSRSYLNHLVYMYYVCMYVYTYYVCVCVCACTYVHTQV
jgi:hypothetical protein